MDLPVRVGYKAKTHLPQLLKDTPMQRSDNDRGDLTLIMNVPSCIFVVQYKKLRR